MKRSCLTRYATCAALILAVVAVDLAVASTAVAQTGQNVTIAPTRVVFDDRDRSEELILVNRGSEPVTYRISLVAMEMADDGRLQRLDEDDAEDYPVAHDLLRFAPRQVRIGPGETQRVRVSVRKPQELQEGEYRSHLLFQAVPDGDSQPQTLDDDDSDELALELNIVTGLSIPAIVRHGEDLQADIDFEELEFAGGVEDGQQQLNLRITRDGNRSVYGRIRAQFVPEPTDEQRERGEEPDPVDLAVRSGTAVYTPNEFRDLELPLHVPEEISLDGGRILVTYESDSTGENLASGEITLD